MTQKQFKEALLRGQGRCIQAAKANPEKYWPVVLWACSHEVAFDPQCEGSRAWYVYQLIGCYEDRQPFQEAVIESLEKTKSSGSWKVQYLAELLQHFAVDGDRAAENALWDKYEALYQVLLRKKRLPEGIFPERDDFHALCVVLADRRAAMVKIAEDIGRLYLTKDFYDSGAFDWLFSSGAKRYMATLKKRGEKSEAIAAYLREGLKEEQALEEKCQEVRAMLSGRRLSAALKKSGDAQAVEAHARAYREQTEPEARAEALDAFCVCPYPEDPSPILEDAVSAHPWLRAAAWRALENITHPKVRQFALEQLEKDFESAFPVWLANYRQEDEALLTQLVASVPVDFACTTAWHSVQIDVLRMEAQGKRVPAALLRYIYESNYCSCCRLDAVEQMGKRRMLTDEILEECLLDSNYDIRSYAGKALARRVHRRKKNGTL